MLTMAKKKPVESASEKRGDPISYRPHPALVAALNEYRDSFRYRPSFSEILDEAILALLRKEGFDLPDIREHD